MVRFFLCYVFVRRLTITFPHRILSKMCVMNISTVVTPIFCSAIDPSKGISFVAKKPSEIVHALSKIIPQTRSCDMNRVCRVRLRIYLQRALMNSTGHVPNRFYVTRFYSLGIGKIQLVLRDEHGLKYR